MENPATWTELEKVIHEALKEVDENNVRFIIGHSRARIIADALRRAGAEIFVGDLTRTEDIARALDTCRAILGRPPRSLESIVQENRKMFSAA